MKISKWLIIGTILLAILIGFTLGWDQIYYALVLLLKGFFGKRGDESEEKKKIEEERKKNEEERKRIKEEHKRKDKELEDSKGNLDDLTDKLNDQFRNKPGSN